MTGQGHKECRAGAFFHTRDRYASVDGLSRLSRTSDGHSFFSRSCVWSSVSGPPCACLRFQPQIGWSLCHPALWRLTSVAWE